MPWPTDPRFASYFLPGYPAALAAVMAAMRSSASPVCGFSATSGAATATGCHNDYSPGAPGGGFLSGLASSSTSPTVSAPPHSNSTFYTPPWESQGTLATNTPAFGSPKAAGGSGDGYMGAGGGGGSEGQRDSAIDGRGQAAFVSFLSLNWISYLLRVEKSFFYCAFTSGEHLSLNGYKKSVDFQFHPHAVASLYFPKESVGDFSL